MNVAGWPRPFLLRSLNESIYLPVELRDQIYIYIRVDSPVGRGPRAYHYSRPLHAKFRQHVTVATHGNLTAHLFPAGTN